MCLVLNIALVWIDTKFWKSYEKKYGGEWFEVENQARHAAHLHVQVKQTRLTHWIFAPGRPDRHAAD